MGEVGNWYSINNGKKKCSLCHQKFTLDAFSPDKSNLKGCKIRSWCKTCMNKKAKEYRKKYPERVRLTQRKNNIKQAYGISLEEFDVLYNKQKGRCAICNISEVEINMGKDKRLFIDHNHTTNKIRGLLCHKCNIGLGGFNDSIVNLEKAIQYLKESD